jgi:hypothetical protein
MDSSRCAFALNGVSAVRQRHTSWTLLILAALSVWPTGCTAVQLRRSTVQQSTTLSDIYTQQVLNNVARFIHDPHALPFFAFPNQGTTAIQDSGSVGGPGTVAKNWLTVPFGFSANRQATENWVLVPVSDPGKLALMQCAYQQAIAPCIGADYHASICPDCNRLRSDFHGEDCARDGDLPCLTSFDCWLCCGKKGQVPKDCCTPYVGCCGDLYVWVPPAGREMLNRLTLTILEYAVNDPAQFSKRTKTVEIYLDAAGQPVKDSDSVKKITAEIPIDQPSQKVADMDNYSEFIQRFGDGMPEKLKARARITLRAWWEEQRDQAAENAEKNGADKRQWLRRQRVLEARLKGESAIETNISEHEYWEDWDNDQFDRFLRGLSGTERNEMRKAAEFVVSHKLIPGDIPTAAELLQGPALYKSKETATAGLQAEAERLKAASGLK